MLDQFSRTLGRGTPQAFTHDARARQVVRLAFERGYETSLSVVERLFLTMPLMHSEELADHEEARGRFAAIARAADGAERQMAQGFVQAGRGHRELIERFGRYPHRNAILGRQSTPEELAHMEAGGESFGQKAASDK